MEYYDKSEVKHYFRVTIGLPIIAMVIIGVFIRSYHEQIKKRFMYTLTNQNLVAIVLVGLTFAVYVLIMDGLALHFAHNDYEYESYNIPKYRLNFFVLTVTIIYDVFIFVYLGAVTITQGILCLNQKDSTKSIAHALYVPYFLTVLFRPTEDKKIAEQHSLWLISSLLYGPLFMMCSHIGYIFVAWLTEPSRSTSVAILLLALLAFLFLLFRSLYKVFHDVFTNANRKSGKDKCVIFWTFIFPLTLSIIPFLYCFLLCTTLCYSTKWKKYYQLSVTNVDKDKEKDNGRNKEDNINVPALILTLFWGSVLGYGSISLFLSAFYMLPISTTGLADYVQILLVIVAALVSYKLISVDNSELSKFLTRFKEAYKQNDNIDLIERKEGQYIKTKVKELRIKFQPKDITVEKNDEKFVMIIPSTQSTLMTLLNNDDLSIPISHSWLRLSCSTSNQTTTPSSAPNQPTTSSAPNQPTLSSTPNQQTTRLNFNSAVLYVSFGSNAIEIQGGGLSITNETETETSTNLSEVIIAVTIDANATFQEINPAASRLEVTKNGSHISDFNFTISHNEQTNPINVPVLGTYQGFPAIVTLDFSGSGIDNKKIFLPSSEAKLAVGKESNITYLTPFIFDTVGKENKPQPKVQLTTGAVYTFTLSLYIQYNDQFELVTEPRALIDLPRHMGCITSSSLKLSLKQIDLLSLESSHAIPVIKMYQIQSDSISVDIKVSDDDSAFNEEDEFQSAGEIAAKVAFKLAALN